MSDDRSIWTRFGEGLIGALLGAVVAGGVVFLIDGESDWAFVYLVMGICFILGFAVGGRFLQFVADLIRHAW